ncbi:UNVERIFIED_CONTAM: hypothetical protein GTU68_012279 [Idotea baltica]|nr:hypothetical protein [Idotea baltica]
MRRCLKIASFGRNEVQSNPLVGSVITYRQRIIGEGWHKQYGGPHAEREALAAISKEDRKHLPQSHLYVSLEPCNHFGKTPPCVDAILEAKIPKVSIAQLDPNSKMYGKSVEKLRAKGVKVNIHDLSEASASVLAPFEVHQKDQRPYVLLKYAVSKDGYLGQEGKQVWLTNNLSKISVHLSRSQVDGIMIGTNTAIVDNPKLTTRLVDGQNPMRIVLDRKERIPKDSHLLNDEHPTLILTSFKNYKVDRLRRVIFLKEEEFRLPAILKKLMGQGINSLMVEGGKQLLTALIKEDLWDECHLYKTDRVLATGIKAPTLKGKLQKKVALNENNLLIISNLHKTKI